MLNIKIVGDKNVLTVVIRFKEFRVVKICVISWAATPNSIVRGYQRFPGTCRLHFYPEHGGDTSLRKVGNMRYLYPADESGTFLRNFDNSGYFYLYDGGDIFL
jgi:hypothetical protein